MPASASFIGATAAAIAEAVRSGRADPRDVLEQHLDHIARHDRELGAFQHATPADAREAAAAVARLGHAERATLALAGVPIAVKDNVPVAGTPMRVGSRATPDVPDDRDHPVVERLRRAGGLIVGKTRVPELCLWGTSDGAFGTARSPWDPARTAGGSSGGSAAAVAAAMVPVAHGNDGLGSVRIPAACCGLVGIKPGPGVVPAEIGRDSWFGMAENGALATTVADAALLLSVMADDPGYARIEVPERPLRIAVALAPPAIGIPHDRSLAAAVRDVAGALAALGHVVDEVSPPMPKPGVTLGILATWGAGAARDIAEFTSADPTAIGRLESRTIRHARWGRVAERLGLVRESHRLRWREQLRSWLERFDVMLTPTLAQLPIAADGWRNRGWLANLAANVLFAPYCGAINFAAFPAAAVPAGLHPSGMPASAHLVGPPGSERLLIGLAAQIEAARPWPRHPERFVRSHGSDSSHRRDSSSRSDS